MTSEWSVSTLRSVYLQNAPYDYPAWPYAYNQVDSEGGNLFTAGGDLWGYNPPIKTGWQVIPNILFSHFLSPKEWHRLMIKYQAFQITGVSCTLFNMIPIQTTLAIQGQSTFSAFNNTIYALGYTDNLYETPPFDWAPWDSWRKIPPQIQFNPVFKEGRYVTKFKSQFGTSVNKERFPDVHKRVWWNRPRDGIQDNQPKTWERQFLPEYIFYKDYNIGKPTLHSSYEISLFDDMSGLFWDPFNNPSGLKELRPGKNAMKYSWSIDESDSHIWFNTDGLAYLWPYGPDWHGNSLFTTSSIYDKPRGVHPVDALDAVQGIQGSTDTSVAAGTGENTRPATTGHQANDDFLNKIDWRYLPIVPTNWFLKEIQESSVWSKVPMFMISKKGLGTTTGSTNTTFNTADNIQTRPFSISNIGTEYAQYKYPPTQWFAKTVPLFDSHNALISVEAQVFMQLTLHGRGKHRTSAYYAPTWGPFSSNSLYSASPMTKYRLNEIRGRSAGARRPFVDFGKPPIMFPSMPKQPTFSADSLLHDTQTQEIGSIHVNGPLGGFTGTNNPTTVTPSSWDLTKTATVTDEDQLVFRVPDATVRHSTPGTPNLHSDKGADK